MSAVPTAQLGLKQFTKEIPPGFRPGSYPVVEYEELVKVWSVLTTLDAEKIGVALFSRLELGALDLARHLKLTRCDPQSYEIKEYVGLEAVQLMRSGAVLRGEPPNQVEVYPACLSGSEMLIKELVREHSIENQDKAWIALSQFFTLEGNGNDFLEYDQQFNSRFEDARTYAGLGINDVGLAYLYWSQSGVDDDTVADLRLKVNGDMTRYREMISLHKRTMKSEDAVRAHHRGKHSFPLLHSMEEYEDESGNYGHFLTDNMFYEYDSHWNCGTYYDVDGNTYHEDYNGTWHDEEDEEYDESEDVHWQDKGKGKSKGKGKKGGKMPLGEQCTECGSKYHGTSNCPMLRRDGDQQSGKGYSSDHDSHDWSEETDEDYWQRRKGKSKGKRPKGGQSGGKSW